MNQYVTLKRKFIDDKLVMLKKLMSMYTCDEKYLDEADREWAIDAIQKDCECHRRELSVTADLMLFVANGCSHAIPFNIEVGGKIEQACAVFGVKADATYPTLMTTIRLDIAFLLPSDEYTKFVVKNKVKPMPKLLYSYQLDLLLELTATEVKREIDKLHTIDHVFDRDLPGYREATWDIEDDIFLRKTQAEAKKYLQECVLHDVAATRLYKEHYNTDSIRIIPVEDYNEYHN